MYSWFRRKAQNESPAPQWMVVHSTDNLAEAHIIVGRLQSEDIPSWVHQQPGASGFGITVGLFGEVRVLVNAEDYDRAVAILDGEPEPIVLEDNLDDVRYVFPDDDQENKDEHNSL